MLKMEFLCFNNDKNDSEFSSPQQLWCYSMKRDAFLAWCKNLIQPAAEAQLVDKQMGKAKRHEEFRSQTEGPVQPDGAGNGGWTPSGRMPLQGHRCPRAPSVGAGFAPLRPARGMMGVVVR